MAGRRRVSVELAKLVPGDVFHVAGVGADGCRFELVEHRGSTSFVRQIHQAEQIEFTRADGSEVAFGAERRPSEGFSSGTRVVVL